MELIYLLTNSIPVHTYVMLAFISKEFCFSIVLKFVTWLYIEYVYYNIIAFFETHRQLLHD